MQELSVIIRNPTGLHARPAKVFVNIAKKFDSSVQVKYGKKKANGKSLISMLALGVESGGQLHILADGNDATGALAALGDAVASGLGEAELIQQVAAEKPLEKPPVVAVPAMQKRVNGSGEPAGIAGVPAAAGVAIGPVYHLEELPIIVDESFRDRVYETTKLDQAIAQARQQLQAKADGLRDGGAAEEAAIFMVHVELLQDETLRDLITENLAKDQSASLAWQAAYQSLAAQLAQIPDETLSGRAADVHDVGRRVLRILAGQPTDPLDLPDKPVILLATELAPSTTAMLDPDRVLGFCTAEGGPTSHSAIIARALGVPAVVGAGKGALDIADGTVAVLDGTRGAIFYSPSQALIARAEAERETWLEAREAARSAAHDPAVTVDNHRVEIAANVGDATHAADAFGAGAEAIGLLRSEFLFLGRDTAPSVAEQTAMYRQAAQGMQGRPVIIRTLDVGGDKPLPYIDVPAEANPFLGERGIRLCLNRPELLQEQLRAIFAAAGDGHLRIMLPMVSDVSELARAREMIDAIRAETNGPRLDVGIMIEVPSAALMADIFAPYVDFFSVGTNDLTQYTMAIDRQHPLLAQQADGLHPAVLRLIKRTIDAAHAVDKWVGICGELAADPQAVPILVGLGIDELSVNIPAVAAVKAQVRQLSYTDAQKLAERALASPNAAAVRQLIP